MKRGERGAGRRGEKMRMEGGKKGGPERDKDGGQRSGLRRDGGQAGSKWPHASPHGAVGLDCYKCLS